MTRSLGRWAAECVLVRGPGCLHLFPADDVGRPRKVARWLTISETFDYEGLRRHITLMTDRSSLLTLLGEACRLVFDDRRAPIGGRFQ